MLLRWSSAFRRQVAHNVKGPWQMTRQIAVFGVVVLLSLVGRSACGQYAVTDLGAGCPYAINASGQVAGEAGNGFAFLYSHGTMTDLGTLGGSESCAWHQ